VGPARGGGVMNVVRVADLGRQRPPACLSDFALDRLQHGELDGTDGGASARRHLATCSPCSQRLAELAAAPGPGLDLEQLLPRTGPALAPPPRARRAGAAALGALLGGVVVAAAGLLLWLGGAPSSSVHRTKGGGWHLGVIAQGPDGRTERLAPGDTVAPGDRLRFEIGAPDDGFVAIVSLDSTGAVTAFYPAAGRALPVAGGRRQLSARSVVLDDALGPEQIILTGCEESFTVEAAVAVARQQLARAGNQPRRVEKLELPCPQTSFWIDKAPR
jgi:hypothetical protein